MYSVVGTDGQVYGPVDMVTLREWCKEGRIVPSTNLLDPISGRVLKAQDLPDLMEAIGPPVVGKSVPPPPVQTPTAQHPPHSQHSSAPYDPFHSQAHHPIMPHHPGMPYNPNAYDLDPPKNKVVAALLALFFGYLGVHRFYLGFNGSGVAQLVLTIGGICTFGITTLVACIWAFIDAILILTGGLNDSKNRPLV